MAYLCIDYGRAHIGLAMANSPLAEPLMVMPASKLTDQLPSLVDKYHIDIIVIGLSEHNMAEETRQFGRTIAQLTRLPVIYHDETLTSQEAVSRLAHAPKRKRQGPEHHYAATLILQDYLDTLPNNT